MIGIAYAAIIRIAKHGHVLTPGRDVGAEDVEQDAEPFAEKYPRLVAERVAAGRRQKATFLGALNSIVKERQYQ